MEKMILQQTICQSAWYDYLMIAYMFNKNYLLSQECCILTIKNYLEIKCRNMHAGR